MERPRVIGNQLVAGGSPLLLRGVNRSGLEYSRGAIADADLDVIADWGANFLRVPFNQDWLQRDDRYLDELASVAERASARGLYVLFDLHWLAYGQRRGRNPDGSNVATPPLPDVDSPRAWQKMAARFAGDPSVMFDLLNEPHDRLPDDSFALHSADGAPLDSPRVTAAEWHPWARRLAVEIRALAPDTPLFVSGTDWGFHCAELDLDNLVQAAHVYPFEGRRTRADWERGFVELASRRPVVVTELGPIDDRLDVIVELLDFLDERGLGWAAWSWVDAPRLVDDSAQPTPFGRLIRERLRSPRI